MVIVGVARYIIKGYSATGVLFVGGLLLLIISAIMGHKVLPSSQASTGYSATDIVEYVKILLMSRGGDLGMMIMMLCGFAAYMTHIGANDMVVKLASKPLQYINSPYLLMIAAYFVACLMSLAVSSATGLGVLLMATLFPVMVNVGISRGAAAAICASPAAIILAPTSGDVVLAAQASEVSLIDFAFKSRKTHLGAGACWFGDCYRCYRADGARNGSSGHRQVNSNAGGKFPPALSCHPLWYMRCGLPTLP